MAEGTRGERMQQSTTSIDFIAANCMGILQLPYQRTYYNGRVPLGVFIVQLMLCSRES